MNPSGPTDVNCVREEEMLIESIIIVMKRLPQFVLPNTTSGLQFYHCFVLGCIKETFLLICGLPCVL